MSTEAASIETVTQRVVPASAAAPAKVAGPNSVFALGGATPADGGAVEFEPDLTPDGKILKYLETINCSAPLKSIAIGAGLVPSRTLAELRELVKAKSVRVIGKGRATAYELSPAGFKGWLRRKGADSAEGRTKRAKKTVPPLKQRVSHALAKPRAPKPAAAPALIHVPTEQSICCGLFSNGDLVIEATGQQLRLDKAQTRHLVYYLIKLDAVLRPEVA